MKSKFTYEALEDILKPKSKKEIKDDFFKKYGFHLNDELDLVEKAFKIIKSASNYIIVSKIGFYHNEVYGFQFETIKPLEMGKYQYHNGEIGEYSFGYWPDENKYYLEFENSGHATEIGDIIDFIQMIEIKDELDELDESIIFKPKSKKELESLIPSHARKFMNELYEIIDKCDMYEIVTSDSRKGMNFYNDGWGFEFRSTNYMQLSFGLALATQIGRFNIKFIPRFGETYIKIENNDVVRIIKNIQGLDTFLNLYPLKESLEDVLKPKSQEEIKTAFEKEYPTFTKIFYEMFPKNKYNLNINKDDISASFSFSETDKNGEVHLFLVNQLSYQGHRDAPKISYLNKSMGGDDFGGIFTYAKKVYNVEDIRTYVEKIKII